MLIIPYEAPRSATRLPAFAAPLLYGAGLLWLALVAAALAWTGLETSKFDTATVLSAGAPFRELRCPRLLGAHEEALIEARFRNDLDRPVSFRVRARFARKYLTLVREEAQQVRIAPGEAARVAWRVPASDAVYGRIVMARARANGSPLGPARQRVCGVLVVPTAGLPGGLALALGLTLGLALIVAGAGLWWAGRRPLDGEGRASAGRQGLLAGTILAALLAALLGTWLPALVLLLTAALLAISLLQHAAGATL